MGVALNPDMLLVYRNLLPWKRAKVRKGAEESQATLRAEAEKREDLEDGDSSGPSVTFLRQAPVSCVFPVSTYVYKTSASISKLQASLLPP